MVYSRLPAKDPRTIARDIPGILNAVFPQLTAGSVAYFNRSAIELDTVRPIQHDLVSQSTLKRTMLFEIAYAYGEQLFLGNETIDLGACVQTALKRQARHYDVRPVAELQPVDISIIEGVGENLAAMFGYIRDEENGGTIDLCPEIPGFQWIQSSEADAQVNDKLIEVKCTSRHFGSADYRQVLIYWILRYAVSIETQDHEWKSVYLINPRLNKLVHLNFDKAIEIFSGGKSKIEVLELFRKMVGDFALKSFREYRL